MKLLVSDYDGTIHDQDSIKDTYKNVDAIKRTTPARSPGKTLFFITFKSIFSLSNNNITGISEQAPNINLTPLNVKAPTNSAPTRCATKAKPHIIAVKKSNIVDLNFVFIQSPQITSHGNTVAHINLYCFFRIHFIKFL